MVQAGLDVNAADASVVCLAKRRNKFFPPRQPALSTIVRSPRGSESHAKLKLFPEEFILEMLCDGF